MILTGVEMILIVAAGAGSVLLTLTLVLCRICPCCPLYKLCRSSHQADVEGGGGKKKLDYVDLAYTPPPTKKSSNGALIVPSVRTSLLETQNPIARPPPVTGESTKAIKQYSYTARDAAK